MVVISSFGGGADNKTFPETNLCFDVNACVRVCDVSARCEITSFRKLKYGFKCFPHENGLQSQLLFFVSF